MPPAGFEPAIRACQRSHTHALDLAAAGVGFNWRTYTIKLRITSATSQDNILMSIMFIYSAAN